MKCRFSEENKNKEKETWTNGKKWKEDRKESSWTQEGEKEGENGGKEERDKNETNCSGLIFFVEKKRQKEIGEGRRKTKDGDECVKDEENEEREGEGERDSRKRIRWKVSRKRFKIGISFSQKKTKEEKEKDKNWKKIVF